MIAVVVDVVVVIALEEETAGGVGREVRVVASFAVATVIIAVAVAVVIPAVAAVVAMVAKSTVAPSPSAETFKCGRAS